MARIIKNELEQMNFTCIKFVKSAGEFLNFNKKYILLFLTSIVFLGCQDQNLEEDLVNGLKNYRKVRLVNETIIDGYEIKKWAFRKTNFITYEFVFQLNDDAKSDTIEKYGLGLVYYADQKYLPDDKSYLMIQTKPVLITRGNFKYIIETVAPPAIYLDSLHMFLTGRDGYTGVIGNMVRLKNIKL